MHSMRTLLSSVISTFTGARVNSPSSTDALDRQSRNLPKDDPQAEALVQQSEAVQQVEVKSNHKHFYQIKSKFLSLSSTTSKS